MRGFILQPTYRIESGRPVVHRYGRLEEGSPFLIRDASAIPHFFIRAADAERAKSLGVAGLHPTDLMTMEGEEVCRVDVALPGDTPPLRDRLKAAGVPAFEADVRFAVRFLIDRGIKGAIEIEGEAGERPAGTGSSEATDGKGRSDADAGGDAGSPPEQHSDRMSGGSDAGADTRTGDAPRRAQVREALHGGRAREGSGRGGSARARQSPPPLVVFESPRLSPAEWAPKLAVLSLDIETDPRGQRVFSIALHGPGHFEVLYVVPPGGAASRGRALGAMRSKVRDAAAAAEGGTRGRHEAAYPAGIDGSPVPLERCEEPQAGGDGSDGRLEEEFTATECASEADLINLFCARVAALDPDVLTGWNVVDFDLRVLDAAARRAGRLLRLGRTSEPVRIRLEDGAWRSSRAEVVGRIVLDGIDLLRGAFVRLEDYRLETAARALLGKGKLIASHDRGEEIERLYREDLDAFLRYNANDARLVTEILEATGVVDLAVRRSLLSGMPPDRVGASIASFDSLYLPELRRRGSVAPSVGASGVVEATAGGAVLEPVTGLHDNVLVFDFRSLYPSLIRTFNIDPLGLIRGPAARDEAAAGSHQPSGAARRGAEMLSPGIFVAGGHAAPQAGGRGGEGEWGLRAPGEGQAAAGGDLTRAGPLGLAPAKRHGASEAAASAEPEPICAPNGALFSRQPGILPALLDRLSSERAAARARGDAIASQAIKILMNSCYGVLATPACRFYSSAVANAITHFGQATLHWTKERAEAMGYAVLYGDTDSLFVAAGTSDGTEARRRGEHLASMLNRDLSEHVRESYGVVSRLELEMQTLYRRLFLPSVRHGTAGARKRYAGLIVEGGKESIHFTGMEMVRRDWTELSKLFQRGLFERVFRGEDPGPWIREFIKELRGGAHDGHLVYRKALRKRISEYTATTPPHVKAAKVINARPGQIIDYVITVNGPEPATARAGSFDYSHYVEKQIRPVAEAVLPHLGLDFDELAGTGDGAGRQLDLFG